MDPYNDLGRYGANKVVRREPCPYCRAGGGDKSGNNLTIYLDGHTHCYACGKHDHAQTTLEDIRKLAEGRDKLNLQEVADSQLEFPRDYTPLNEALYAKEGIRWIKGYGITDDEIEKHHIGWSSDRNMLIFPVYDTAGSLVMWQGRNFQTGQKYLTFGNKSDIMYLCGNSKSGTVVVTEDLVSAIKVGRVFQAMPLWGASMTVGLMQKLADRFDDMGVWLDRDKVRESVLIALRSSQYLPTFVVSSTVDPKNYRDEVLAQLVWSAQQKDSVYKENKHDPKDLKEEREDLSIPTSSLKLFPNAHPQLLGPDGSPIRMAPDYSEHDWKYTKSLHGS